MGSFQFWQKWLLGFGLYLTLFGIILSLFPHSTLLSLLFNQQIDPSFWPQGLPSESSKNFQGWAYGLLGSVMSAWGGMISFIAYYPFKNKEKWAWNSLSSGFFLWFILDIFASAKYGVNFNLVVNLLFLGFILPPLLFTRKYFFHKSS